MSEEIWKDIEGFEGYQISSLGRVKSIAKNINRGEVIQHRKERILKALPNSDGYLRVGINSNGKNRKLSIHRLIAKAFIPNPNNYPCINHKDENKLNNSIDNLEWCSYAHNVNWGTALERRVETQSIPVEQYDLEGNLIASYSSSKEASLKTGIDKNAIRHACKQYQDGYIWKYKNKI